MFIHTRQQRESSSLELEKPQLDRNIYLQKVKMKQFVLNKEKYYSVCVISVFKDEIDNFSKENESLINKTSHRRKKILRAFLKSAPSS